MVLGDPSERPGNISGERDKMRTSSRTEKRDGQIQEILKFEFLDFHYWLGGIKIKNKINLGKQSTGN